MGTEKLKKSVIVHIQGGQLSLPKSNHVLQKTEIGLAVDNLVPD